MTAPIEVLGLRRHPAGWLLRRYQPPELAMSSNLDAGSVDDRVWFARHVGRNHRIRPPIGAERRLFGDVPPGWHPFIVVRQIKPGARVRLKTILGAKVLNAEASVARLFVDLLDDNPGDLQRVAELERAVREGRL